MNQPDIVISHGPSCQDGFTAAWIVEGKWPRTPLVMGVYQTPPPDVTGLGVLITDFSYPEDVLREMAEKAKWIHVLDHHSGAEPHLRKLAAENVIKLTFDLEKSGAALTWDYCWGTGRVMPWLVQHVQDRDLWRFDLEGTRAVSAVLGSHPMNYENWSLIAKRLEDPAKRQAVYAEGAAIVRSEMRNLQAIIDATQRIMMIDGHEVPVANVPYFWASEAGNIMAVGHPFAATYHDGSDGRRKFSLRSAKDGGLDVSEIAAKFGGGGHEHAAGFAIPILELAVEQEEVEAVEPAPADTVALAPAGKPIKVPG